MVTVNSPNGSVNLGDFKAVKAWSDMVGDVFTQATEDACRGLENAEKSFAKSLKALDSLPDEIEEYESKEFDIKRRFEV